MDRESQKTKELSESKLLWKALKKERESFDYAEASQFILDDKCDTDLIYIQETISEWSKSAKNDNQKKVLNDMFFSILRVNTYIDQMRVLNKGSVAKFVGCEKKLTVLQSELRMVKIESNQKIIQLEKQLEDAKKEIEFINSSK
jgi:hypothetical protein